MSGSFTEAMRHLLVLERHESLTGSHEPALALCQQSGVENQCFDLLQWRYRQPSDDCQYDSSRLTWAVRDDKTGFGNNSWTVEASLPFISYVWQHQCKRLSCLPELESYSLLFVLNAAVGVTKQTLRELLARAEEYHCKDGHTVICSSGYRLFPHSIPDQPCLFWSDAKYVRYFGPLCSARAVHVFGSACCVVPASLLSNKVAIRAPESLNVAVVPEYWLSYVWQQQHHVSIWKVKVEYISEPIEDKYIATSVPDIKTALEAMYQYHSCQNWPLDINSPLPAERVGPSCISQCSKPWQNSLWGIGFGGVNMISDPVELDFEAAAAYGVRVIRIGATGDGKDLDYLVCDDDFVPREELLFENDSEQMSQHIGKLQKSLLRAEMAGLKVIITLTKLPGRDFKDEKDHRFWKNPLYHKRLICLWELLVVGLKDQRHIVAGYDIMNEPFTPCDATEANPLPSPVNKQLDSLYRDVIKEIRKHDKDTPIILESTYWSSPEAFPFLEPVDDPLVVYSFHLYHPQVLTCRSKNRNRFQYPGEVSLWAGEWGSDKTFWNKEKLVEFLEPVVQFQDRFGIDSKRILVGEFGISREIPGAKEYLSDLVALFGEKGWSWCLFSFRDPEWDSMDYELGDDMANMLHRHSNDLFLAVAEHFH